jgi:hypothetical protein
LGDSGRSGAARRLTFRPATEPGTGGRHGPDNMVVTWTPDSRNVVYLSKGDQWNDCKHSSNPVLSLMT